MKLSFSGHETFPFRYPWLPKGVQRLKKNPLVFVSDDGLVKLGVGKNMVRSIRHWSIVTGMVAPLSGTERGHKPTPLGERLLGTKEAWDPYLEDIGTLWLLHWQLVRSLEQASSWYLGFTTFAQEVFTRENLLDWTLAYAREHGARATKASLKRDIDVFLRTYAPGRSTRQLTAEDSFDCPLVELGLIRQDADDTFRFVRGLKRSLPDAILLYAIEDYWQSNTEQTHLQSLSFEKLLYGEGSPGAAFKLAENALAERLEQLTEKGFLRFDETAGMRVIYRGPEGQRNLNTILQGYYTRGGGR